MDHRYKLPQSLQEAKLVVPAERKPAALAALLQVNAEAQRPVWTAIAPCIRSSVMPWIVSHAFAC